MLSTSKGGPKAEANDIQELQSFQGARTPHPSWSGLCSASLAECLRWKCLALPVHGTVQSVWPAFVGLGFAADFLGC